MGYQFEANKLVPRLAFAIKNELARIVEEHVPALKPDMPSFAHCDFEIGANDNLCIVVISFKDNGIDAGGKMKPEKFAELEALVGNCREYQDLKRNVALAEFFDWRSILIARSIEYGSLDWEPILKDLIAWAIEFPLPRARAVNEARPCKDGHS